MGELNLEGLWASGIFYYDAFEETVIGFSNKGLGFIHYMRPFSDHIELFKWKFNTQENISLTVNKTFTFYNNELSESDESDTVFEDIKVIKFDKDTFTGEIIEAIEFSKPLFLNDTVYGLFDKDISKSLNRIKMLLGSNLPIQFNSL
jgi:hypothetical protein